MLENNLGKRPLFSVGEEVLLQSVELPAFNGECTVLSIRVNRQTGSIGYRTTIRCPSKVSAERQGWWAQSALRKKHKPSEHSFDSLMADLKSKGPRNAKA